MNGDSEIDVNHRHCLPMFYDIVRDTQLGIRLRGRKMMCVVLRSFIDVDIMGSSV